MHVETERKFLVRDSSWKASAVSAIPMVQGYIAHDAGNTVRVRILGDKGILTVKGPSVNGMSRLEWEKEIPLEDARDLIRLCHGGIIDKTRYIVPAGGGLRFEVDEFHGDNAPLVMAEIELPSEDFPYERPQWLGEEVTGDKRYYNSWLTVHPYKGW